MHKIRAGCERPRLYSREWWGGGACACVFGRELGLFHLGEVNKHFTWPSILEGEANSTAAAFLKFCGRSSHFKHPGLQPLALDS